MEIEMVPLHVTRRADAIQAESGCDRFDAIDRARYEDAHNLIRAGSCPFHGDRPAVRNGMCGACAEKADDAR